MIDARSGIDPLARCPRCRHVLNAATSATDDARPEAGDVSICIGCALYLIFVDGGAGLTVRAGTADDVRALSLEQREILNDAARMITGGRDAETIQ
jgi:hypothetical protein